MELPSPTLFVRPDGDDECDGRADAPGPAGAASCALATIEAATQRAQCGDVVAIRAGRYGEPRITVGGGCPKEVPIEFRGDGAGATWWMAALTPVTASACSSADGIVHTCPLPDDAWVPAPPEPSWAFVQTNVGSVRFEDENGVKGDMTGPMALTWNTLGPADQATKPGSVAVEAPSFHVHPWNGLPPAEAELWATRGCGASSSNAAIELDEGSVVLRNLSVVSGCGAAIVLRGDDQTLEGVDVFTGSVTLAATSVGARLSSVRILNAYRRPVDMGATSGGEAWSTNSQSLSVWGSGFLLEDIETYASREGAGFANGAHDGVVDGAVFHGHHNHGFKIQDETTHDIVFRDVLAYNAQEAAFIECPRDITFSHVTLPSGPVVVQGNPGGCTPARLSFVESVLCGVTWFAYGGDTWAEPGGHVFERNVYVSGTPACDGEIRHLPSDSTFDVDTWRAWDADPCTDCVRDEGSVGDDVSSAFVHFAYKDDTQASNPDFRPTPSAAAIDLGTPDAADASDLDGTPRDGAPDAGCYEYAD